MRIGAHQRIGVTDSIFIDDTLRQVFEVNLMADTQTGRHNSKSVKRLPAPLQELIARMVALEFHCNVSCEGIAGGRKIDLHRMIDYQIDRHQRFHDFWIASQSRHG